MEKIEATTDYCMKIVKRLELMNFSITSKVQYDNNIFAHVGKRVKLWFWTGPLTETFFVLAEFNNIDISELRDYSRKCFAYALSKKSIPLPWGIFHTAVCYSVAIGHNIDSRTATAVRCNKPLLNRRGFEIPVIYDVDDSQLYYPEETPKLDNTLPTILFDPGTMAWKRLKGELVRALSP